MLLVLSLLLAACSQAHISGPDAGPDAGGRDTGAAHDAGRPGSALQFVSDLGRAAVPDLGGLYPDTFTYELWAVLPATAGTGMLLHAQRGGTYELFQIRIWTDGTLQCIAGTGTSEQVAAVPIGSVPRGEPVHVACTRDGMSQVLWVEGRAVATVPARPYLPPSGSRLAIGVDSMDPPCCTGFRGTLDELRVSSIARYTGRFEPQRRFSPDAETRGLWHFDEGAGSILRDASATGADGSVSEVSWVPEP